MVRCRVGAFILICDNSVVFNEAKIFEYMVDIIFLCDTPTEWLQHKHWFFQEQYLTDNELACNATTANYPVVVNPASLK